MEWINPIEKLPEDRAHVAALMYHWKECWPLSAEIMFGEVESYVNDDGERIARVNTYDFTGAGGSYWSFPCYGLYGGSDVIRAWCYAKEFKRPAFIEHNPHWGQEK